MRPVIHPSNNLTLDKPTNTNGVEIHPLTVTECEDGGIPYMVSFWKPFPEELDVLKEGGTVQLWILGQRQPVVSLAVNESGVTDVNQHITGFNSMKDREPNAKPRRSIFFIGPGDREMNMMRGQVLRHQREYLPDADRVEYVFHNVHGSSEEIDVRFKGLNSIIIFMWSGDGPDHYKGLFKWLATEFFPVTIMKRQNVDITYLSL
jgi:hypothetical protein